MSARALLALAGLAGALALASCGSRDTDSGPGGVTVGEARALDQAASMLDQQRLPAEALQPDASPSPQDSPTAAAS